MRFLHPWNFPGKITGVGCHFLLQGIFPTQRSNPGLLHCKQLLLPSEPLGKLPKLETGQKLGNSVQFGSVAQSCPTLSDPIDGSPLGSLVPGILQARTLEWVAISFSIA